MFTPPTLGEPKTKAEIATELTRLHNNSTVFWNSLSTEAFFAPLGQAWSPADNVRHLTKSIRPVAKALSLPKLAPWLLFGPARNPSRTFAEIRTTYQQALARGGQAGRFAPRPLPALSDPEGKRREIMVHRERAAAALLEALEAESWSEKWLDRVRLPHPLLGKLTVREMLFFTLYHNLHHLHGVQRRLDSER